MQTFFLLKVPERYRAGMAQVESEISIVRIVCECFRRAIIRRAAGTEKVQLCVFYCGG